MLKEGYKKYEFGYIPNDWKIKKIGDIYDDLKAGATPSRTNPSYFTGDIPWITSGELKSKYIYDTYEKITEEAVKNTNLKIYQKGTFFIAITGLEAAGTRGSCGINGIDSATNQSCLAFQEKEEINTEFLYYWYSLYGDYIGKKYTQGTKQQSLNNKIVEELCIGFPNKEEQEKIADILSTVDCQIDDTEMFIEKCQELKKGLMQKLLTKGIGHTEFKKTEVGDIPVDWGVKKLEDVSYITMGQSPSSDSYNDKGIGVPFFQGNSEFGNIYPTVKKWCSEPKKIAEPLDILISVRAPVGAVNINNDRACIGRGLASIRQSNKINYMYLYYVLSISQDILNSSAQGSTFTAINSKDLKNFKIAIPSLDEQLNIAEILLSLDNNIEDYKNKKQKLENLKKGLMQQLLTGKLRIKNT